MVGGTIATINENMSEKELAEAVPTQIRTAISEGTPQLAARERWKVARDRWSLNVHLVLRPGPDSVELPMGPILEQYENEIGRIIHLPALRGNPKRTYRTAAVEENYPGTFNDYTAGIISAWQNRSQTDKLEQLSSDLERLGLTSTVEARQLDDTSVALLVGRLPHARPGGLPDLVNIADVGFGVSQTLPVLVALIVAANGQLVYLEQPEIHLHPRAQTLFATLLSAAVKRGARVVVETHSSLLLRAIQTLVAQGEMSPHDVALHWFSRNPVSGSTSIATAALDRFGSFGDWPEDFDEVSLKADHDYLTASEAAEAAVNE
jgi:hypothetical protein